MEQTDRQNAYALNVQHTSTAICIHHICLYRSKTHAERFQPFACCILTDVYCIAEWDADTYMATIVAMQVVNLCTKRRFSVKAHSHFQWTIGAGHQTADPCAFN